MHDPNQRREKFGQIKVYLAKCAVVDAWRGMKPTLYPKRLQDAQLCFSPATKDPTDENTVVESEKSEAEPSIPSPERPQPNPVTRKHPATESLPEAFPQQPRQQQIAVSAMAGDNTEVLQLPIQTYNTDFHSSSQRRRAKTFIEAASPEVWSTVLRVHENAKSNTSAALEEKCHELEVVQAHLGKLIKELEETQASIYITDEKVERVAAQQDEFDEYRVFIGHMILLCDAGPKGLERVVDALSEQGLEFKTLIYEHVSDGQASFDK
ncbi:hypothetical protein FOC4_g10005080 [Fusarium odoratissimum]|uniref:Uncharacterized protein n=1 Tax=Fusarium oxysporum f. sp. cubense (strain race 4) TaxID=2502994 RepID=N1RQT8_FUSC4|nr:hypothetical protein FOC4_g10005080 [Fusarium odoratissimum]